MPRDPRYDVLFDPVRIGPVASKNRFFQAGKFFGGLPFRREVAELLPFDISAVMVRQPA